MPAEDLNSRTPGALDDASRAFVDRIATRKDGIGGTASHPDAEIDDTGLPLDNSSDGSVSEAASDLDGDNDNRPDSDNPDDVGENEARPADKTNTVIVNSTTEEGDA